jgi:hypothetical protein
MRGSERAGANMTIAACYVTPEGVVLGADSAASIMLDGGFHYFNYNQKVFEIGELGQGTLGLVTWGLGNLGAVSHRTLIGRLYDLLANKRPKTVKEVAERWIDLVWTEYDFLAKPCRDLNAKLPYDASGKPSDPRARTEQEEQLFGQLKRGLVLGFFLGGHLNPSRAPQAFSIAFDPLLAKPTPIQFPTWNFAGAPNMIKRLLFGFDEQMREQILNSGKWGGTPTELDTLLAKHQLTHPVLPIRDAIDFVHACISSTIKAMKFSSLAQVCGGPIEIAVITTDRRFRWVRHKEWDAAITEGDP